MCPPGGNTAAKPQHGVAKTEQSRAVEGLAFGPGVLTPNPQQASKQERGVFGGFECAHLAGTQLQSPNHGVVKTEQSRAVEGLASVGP